MHRQRLQDALVTLVAERGFPETSIREICSHAHVGPRDLYAQYPGKQELLLSTCDAIVAEAIAAVRASQRAATTPPDSVESAVASVLVPFARALSSRPAHASLILVDVFSAGAVGPPYRRGLVTQLRGLLADALAELPFPRTLSEASLIVVAAGVLQAFQRRIRTGRTRSLPAAALELAAWAAQYQTVAPLPLPAPIGATAPATDPAIEPLPRNTQRLPRQFVVPHQRDRILRAVVTLAARDGYAAMSIPGIAAEAQISIRTFYQHFASKHEAFEAIYDHAFGRLFARTWGASTQQESWLDAVREGVRAWVAFIATEPGMARFGVSDVLTAGREAVEKVDDAYSAFADLFAAGRPGDEPVSELVSYAIAGGIGGLIAHWIADGRATDAPQLEPHLVYAILAPATGDAEALHASGLAPVPTVIPAPVPSDDGQRTAAAYAQLVATDGFPAATLEAAARIAGVAPTVATEYFDDETACALQTVDGWTDRTFTAMAAAFASAPRDGALAVHRALGAMLAQMASEPEMLHLAVEAVEHLGPRAVSRRARYASLFFDAVSPVAGPNDAIPAQTRQLSEMVVDGVFGVLRRHVRERRIAELPAALPEISYLCLAPFFGVRRANDVAQLPFAAALAPSAR
ncbi:MAG: TetR/AcrR family transcriptional regulator [Patulibacter sp.]|nr:TetR/AcrR family transcriptional regulator [Patulibacter sp.]